MSLQNNELVFEPSMNCIENPSPAYLPGASDLSRKSPAIPALSLIIPSGGNNFDRKPTPIDKIVPTLPMSESAATLPGTSGWTNANIANQLKVEVARRESAEHEIESLRKGVASLELSLACSNTTIRKLNDERFYLHQELVRLYQERDHRPLIIHDQL